MLKKIAQKNKNICPGPPRHEQFFFLQGTKEKKTSFGGPREKKSSSRSLKKGSFFENAKKLLKIWYFLNIKVVKFKLNYLG